jgi:hypothetical protein
MKLTPNQCDVLAALIGGDQLIAAEVAARSGRQYIPGVIRALESLRDDGLVALLDGPAGRRWRITEPGQAALARHSRVRS